MAATVAVRVTAVMVAVLRGADAKVATVVDDMEAATAVEDMKAGEMKVGAVTVGAVTLEVAAKAIVCTRSCWTTTFRGHASD